MADLLVEGFALAQLEGKTVRIVLFQAQEQEKTENHAIWNLDLVETSTNECADHRKRRAPGMGGHS